MPYVETTCTTCESEFETRENWLYENETCPECFEYPDVEPNGAPRDEFDVYLVSRVQAVPKSGVEANYYRVAGRSESEALWFTEAYQILDYDCETEARNRQRLASLGIDADGQANTRTNPVLTAAESSQMECHDGYTVRELGFRSTSADAQRQERRGPNTTDQITNPTDMNYKDVLIHASEDEIDHKLKANVPDGHKCYWTVSGTPRQTRFGQRVWFETDGRIVAVGQVYNIEAGKIWFTPLERVDADVPEDPPNQGFMYLDTEERPDVEVSA